MEVTKGVKEARKTIRTGVKMPAPGRRASAMDASPSPPKQLLRPPPPKQKQCAEAEEAETQPLTKEVPAEASAEASEAACSTFEFRRCETS